VCFKHELPGPHPNTLIQELALIANTPIELFSHYIQCHGIVCYDGENTGWGIGDCGGIIEG
jgi:hypothetical protein